MNLRKSIISILCLISLFLSFSFALYYKDIDIEKIENIEQTKDVMDIYIKTDMKSKKEFVETLTSISKKNKATITRTDEINDGEQFIIYKSIISTNKFFNQTDVPLISGKLPNKEKEFIATFDTQKQNQVGIIRDFFSDTSLIMCSLSDFLKENEVSLSGKYSVNVKDKDNFLKDISIQFGMSENEILYIPYTKEYKKGVLLYIILILLIILLAVLMLVSLFSPLSNLKTIGILKLQGYTNFSSYREINKIILIYPIIFYFISLPIHIYFVKIIDIKYILLLSLVQSILIIVYYLCFFTSLIMINKYKLSHVINGYFNSKLTLYFNYFWKWLIFSLLIFLIPLLSKEISTLKETLDVKKLYQEQEQYLTLSSYEFINNEFQEKLNNNNKGLTQKILDLFKVLEKNSNAQYMSAEKLYPIYLKPEKTKRFNDIYFNQDEFIYVVQANWNYIKTLDLSLEEKNSNKSYKVLIPSSQKKNTKRIEAILRPHINSFYEDNMKYQSIDDIPIDNFYYKDMNTPIFSNNIDLINENKGLINNPIILVMDDYSLSNTNSRLLDGVLYNPIRILNTKNHIININSAIKSSGLENNNLKFENSFNAGYKKELNRIQTTILFYVFILLLSLLVSLLSSYFIILITLISQRKEILISKFLGYSIIDTYINQLMNFFIIYLFGLIEIFLLKNNSTSLIIYCILIISDLLITILMVKEQDNLLLKTSLKGEFR